MDRLSKVTDVGEIMRDAPPVVSEETSYKTTVSLLKEFSFVLVKGKKGFIGLVTKADVLGAR
jgi:predicted transcriptional regulator